MEEPNQNNPEKKPAKKQAKKPAKKKAAKKPSGKNIAKQPSLKFAALSAMFGEPDPNRVRYRKNVKLMCGQLEEYMSSYILIGYDVDGEAVTVTYSPNQQGYDALSTNLQRYVFDSINRDSFPPGNPMK